MFLTTTTKRLASAGRFVFTQNPNLNNQIIVILHMPASTIAMPPRKPKSDLPAILKQMLKNWKEMLFGLGVMVSLWAMFLNKIDIEKMFGLWMSLGTLYVMLINKRKDESS